MRTISELIELAYATYGKERTEVCYVYPSLYVVCLDDEFDNASEDEREQRFAGATGIGIADIQRLKELGLVELCLLTKDERKADFSFLDGSNNGQHWLSWLNPLNWKDDAPTSPQERTDSRLPRAVHFYGYKGGQARSSVLVLFAKMLADTGLRVLVVDADLEAPSLDMLLDASADDPNATLMGACGWGDQVSPLVRTYVGQPKEGTVDLLACRPRPKSYDMDFAAFVLGSALDARTLEHATAKLREFAGQPTAENSAAPRYDVTLFDHRTGLTSSVLPIMDAWPGPASIFLRPDGMSRNIEGSHIVDTILAHDPDTPGAFVSFSLDPAETTEDFMKTHGAFVERHLELLSDALTRGAGASQDIDPTELERYWIRWGHDSALLTSCSPAPRQLSQANQGALSQLREVLGLDQVTPRPIDSQEQTHLTRSGATDQGWFILTPDIAKLFSRDSKFLYVFGRKGTGKTRLYRELHSRALGEPLLAANDFDQGGLKSNGVQFADLMKRCGGDFQRFWWTLIHAALECVSTNGELLMNRVRDVCSTDDAGWVKYGSPSEVEDLILKTSARRVFLIDGVETAVPANELRPFVESLFLFLATIQFTPRIASRLTIRLFLRSDLAIGAVQNIEQQVERHFIQLRWDKTSILNFALGRIACLGWFRNTFRDVIGEIDKLEESIGRGGITDEKAEEILLAIFPSGLERNKLKTTTFFATYFSDAGGDNDSKASFYPRLFDAFLRGINDSAESGQTKKPALLGGRLDSPFVLTAYDLASAKFIEEVQVELHSLLNLEDTVEQNKSSVDKLIQSFEGQKTPFVLDEMIKTLSDRSGLAQEKVRDALRKMKDVGVFEDRPGYPGSWRTGRLYKSGLKMKYVR